MDITLKPLRKLKFINCQLGHRPVYGWINYTNQELYFIFDWYYWYARLYYSQFSKKYVLEFWDSQGKGYLKTINGKQKLHFDCIYKAIRYVHKFMLQDDRLQIISIDKDKPFIDVSILNKFSITSED